MTEPPEPDEDDLLKRDLDGVTVVKTGTGTRYVSDWPKGGPLRLLTSGGEAVRKSPGDLLDDLKNGEYYLPHGSGDFQDALRHLRDNR